ncbi:hypothetical protein J7J84_04375 [bacterium]|nr:hypothetical protein [bacterium]
MLYAFSDKLENTECVFAVLAYRVTSQKYDVLYVGETKNLGETLLHHPKRDIWLMANATHVYVHSTNTTREHRREIARSIINDFAPPFNNRHASVA